MKERNRRECSGVVEQREHESNVLVMRGMAQRRNETRAGVRGSWGEASVSRTWLRHGDRETKERNAGGCGGIMEWGKRESKMLAMRDVAQRRDETRAGARGLWGEASLSRKCLRHGDRETKERNAGRCAAIRGLGGRESNLLVARTSRNERSKLARLEWEG